VTAVFRLIRLFRTELFPIVRQDHIFINLNDCKPREHFIHPLEILPGSVTVLPHGNKNAADKRFIHVFIITAPRRCFSGHTADTDRGVPECPPDI